MRRFLGSRWGCASQAVAPLGNGFELFNRGANGGWGRGAGGAVRLETEAHSIRPSVGLLQQVDWALGPVVVAHVDV